MCLSVKEDHMAVVVGWSLWLDSQSCALPLEQLLSKQPHCMHTNFTAEQNGCSCFRCAFLLPETCLK